ncbi:pentatricopeptide repeat-containing protein At1g71490-like [Phoenix dactylifera]|uniref:Pentatricopeptide repeat-containing protein At1g71490-like n=1 Tax=Phoenix dactylifera TaxID=42345 RepID=A0A8B8ZNC0_PHODC|nr:pentatricopeptide repeat-containing protein At1g71490-like [Phoenix dactylifera]
MQLTSLELIKTVSMDEKEIDKLKPPSSPATPLIDSINSLSAHGHISEAFAAFSLLLRFHSSSRRFLVRPLTSLLSCSIARRSLPQGQQLHALVLLLGLSENLHLVFKLTSLYSAFDLLADARAVVEGAIKMQTLPWNLLLSAYVRSGCWEDAILAYKQMVERGVRVDKFTYSAVLKACGEMRELELGRDIHRSIDGSGLEWDLYVWNALVALYVKCGALEIARKVFDGMAERDVVTWNSMISGYASKGMWEEAFQLLERMPEASEACSRLGSVRVGKEIHGLAIRFHCDKLENVKNTLGKGITSLKLFNEMIDCGIEPDHITMVAVLSACSHSGLSITLAMVDLYGRAGLLRKAEEIIDQMPLQPSAAMLATLVEACRVHGNIKIGERFAKKLLEMKSDNPSHYVLIANMYASARCWQKLAKVRILMRDMGIQKAPSCSWLDLGNNLYPFQVDSTSKERLHNHVYLMLSNGVSLRYGLMKQLGFKEVNLSFEDSDINLYEEQGIGAEDGHGWSY